MRNNKQTVPTTKNTSTTPDETIRYMELSDEDALRVVGGAGVIPSEDAGKFVGLKYASEVGSIGGGVPSEDAGKFVRVRGF